MTTLAAAWADAWSCQAPTVSTVHVAEKKISIFLDAVLSCDTVGTRAKPAGLGPRGFAAELCTQRVPVRELITNCVNQTCHGISQSVLTS